MGLIIDDSILAVKLHATDADPVPTGAANGMAAYDISLNPLQADEYEDKTVRGFVGGGRDKIYYNKSVSLDFKVDWAGSGVAGTAPAWDPLALASGLEKGSSTAEATIYKPAVYATVARVAIYFYIGGVLHVLLKARGNMEWDVSISGKPFLKFSFQGLFVPVTDAVVPSLDISAFKTGVMCTPENTPTFTIHGYAAKMSSFSGTLGVAVKATRFVGYHEFDIKTRTTTAKAVIEATTVAEKDFFGIVTAHTKGDVSVVHGVIAGSIGKLDLLNTQLSNPSYSDMDGVQILNVDITAVPLSKNSDFVMTMQ